MKSEELLQKTLEQTGIPVKPYEYLGKNHEYMVFNEEDERGILHADNRPQGMSVWWQVHIFAPRTSYTRKRKRQVRNLLLNAGFVVGDTDTFFEKDTKTMHVVITCCIDEDMEE
ncbi:hypothetical protein RO787_06555 [Blautia coccoides]|uniref:hypothetical protein n=1 Tax=Blautia producta TaxID=33035 RepID=UPI0028A548FD|nr:hypothetical protein [Blautia coccoides]MDT4373004.1 hypothetical protein [Blautia coccoides]